MLDDTTRARIQAAIDSRDVLLFMKGSPAQPQCGFSATVIQILNDVNPDYGTVDVLADPEVRQGIKEFSSWPTIPQLYVKGEFVGGCDIIQEMYGSGELYETFGLPVPKRVPPTLHVSERAAAFIRDALEQEPQQTLHLRIAANFEPRLYLGPEEAGELVAEAGGLRWYVDLPSSARAEGIRIDYVETPQGHELRVDNPNAPASVKEIGVRELKALLDSDGVVHLFDVRSAEERAVAQIPGARVLDEQTAREIEALPKDTRLLFHCHHGSRSLKAAEHFLALGFDQVYNVVGGIDAWSRQVDDSVPRY